MNRTEKELCSQLIERVMQPEFGIPMYAIERLWTLDNRVKIIHIRSSKEEIRLRLPGGGWVYTLGISQVIDVPPAHWTGSQCEGSILLILADEDEPLSEWTMIHELCHLMSIGPYEKVKTGWRHSYGINEFIYQQKNGQMICQARQQDAINELMTDLAVWILMKDREIAAEAPYRGLELFADYAKACVPGPHPLEMLVGSYVSGKSECIHRWLLGAKWKSYDALNTALRKRLFRIKDRSD